MRKNKLFLTIGLPGCGKSTWAKEHCRHNTVVHSSDGIREELVRKGAFSSVDSVPNDLVFSTMQKRTENDLSRGNDVVYDATNISRKDRNRILTNARRLGVKRVAVLFLVPVSECKCRNENRKRTVPEWVIDRMLRRFDVPMIGAEFDEILVVESGEMTEREEYLCSQECRNGFEQHSPFHALTVGDHLEESVNIYDEHEYAHPKHVREAVAMHDYGKPHTFFIGEDDKGHFYGHENAGAYWYLVNNMPKSSHAIYDLIVYKVAMLINWHMRPYVWEKSDKAKLRDMALIDRYNPDMYGYLMAMSEADRRAH